MSHTKSPRRLTMPQYLTARLEQLSDAKSLDDIVHEMGLKSENVLSAWASGKARVSLGTVLSLAKALGAPILPFFRLAMEQWELGELAAAVCERTLVEGASSAARPTDKTGSEGTTTQPPDLELDEFGPLHVALCFDVPSEFCRQFRLEAANRRLSGNELLLLSFQTYLAYRESPSKRRPAPASSPSDVAQRAK